MSYLFISDLHLMEERPDITAALGRFLSAEVKPGDTLYVLGDLFEVWLGDDHKTAFNQEIIDLFAATPCKKYLMHGNRDFLIGQVFCDLAGFELLPDPTVHLLHGEPTLLMHGDSLCTRDEAYMQIRTMLRNPAFQAELLTKTLAERQAIAMGARQESKAHTRETTMDIMDVTPSEVDRVMAETGVRRLIHGHTHRPDRHQLSIDDQDAERIVLGDWDNRGWVLRVSEGETPALINFDI